MELMDGDLDSFKGALQQPLDEADAADHPLWKLAQDMSVALYHLHNVGLSHNDIKPANILWRKPRGGTDD